MHNHLPSYSRTYCKQSHLVYNTFVDFFFPNVVLVTKPRASPMLGWVSYIPVLTRILKCQPLGLHLVRFLHGVICNHSSLIFNLPFSSFGVILLIISSGSALLTLPQFELLGNLLSVEKRLPSGDLWESLWGVFLIDSWCCTVNTVCGTTPSQEVLRCIRKQDEQTRDACW